MNNHSDGPWTTRVNEFTTGSVLVYDCHGVPIAEIFTNTKFIEVSEAKANIDLIKVSPKLLAAAVQVMHLMHCTPYMAGNFLDDAFPTKYAALKEAITESGWTQP